MYKYGDNFDAFLVCPHEMTPCARYGEKGSLMTTALVFQQSVWGYGHHYDDILAIIVINIIIINTISATWLTTKPSLLKSLERTPAWEIGRAEPAPTSSDSNTAFLNLSRFSKRLYEKIKLKKKTIVLNVKWTRETLVVQIHLDLCLQSVT